MTFTSACRVATGRSAILHMARRWNPEHVFIPCFVPEGVIRPFQAAGTKIVFYKLTEELLPDLHDLFEKMRTQKGERPVIVDIHYFGMESWRDLTPLAHEFGGIVLSDYAQAMVGAYSTADVVLYSLNKFLPVTDGAILASRNPALDVSLDHTALQELPYDITRAYHDHLEANAAIARAPVETVPFEALRSERAYNRYYEFIDKFMEPPMAQSAASRAIEAASDIELMSVSRGIRSRILCQKLRAPFLVRQQETAQFAFPVRCHGYRDEMIDALSQIDVLPGTLRERWNHIPVAGYEIEAAFIDDHLLLPIGETVSVDKLNEMAAVINAFEIDEKKCPQYLH
ncbi:MAG TPA: hypothetical protein VMT89_09375 [Candidatus Acidoferrales bacterium]|nr:hypothetical protein [Candidatus Acidoferrales bacterium]